MPEKIRVLHIITGLQTGGAEMMLLKLLQQFPEEEFDHQVMSILGHGELTDTVRQNCRDIIVLDLVRNIRHPMALWRAIKMARGFKPDVIQGWMYHGNLFASLSNWFIGPKSIVIWNLRCSEPAKGGFVTELVRKLCIFLSARPAHVIANSKAGMDYHLGINYRPKSKSVIPNGVDILNFAPDNIKRAQFRASLLIPEAAIVIGIAASFREMKDYPNFLRAVVLLGKQYPDVVFLAAGRGVSPENPGFKEMGVSLVKEGQLKLLEEVKDISSFMNALDIFTLSSKMGEGFPNVIAEAMASGTPCVVTDAGDSTLIVDKFGLGVPTQSPEALAEGWETLLTLGSEPFKALKTGGRDHIVRNYQMSRITQEYVELYLTLLQKNT